MSLPNQTSLQGTIQQLKDIVTGLKGEDHEVTHLVQQMESLVAQIEKKTRRESKDSPLSINPSTAQATV